MNDFGNLGFELACRKMDMDQAEAMFLAKQLFIAYAELACDDPETFVEIISQKLDVLYRVQVFDPSENQ